MKTVSIILPCYNEEESLPIYFKAVDPVINNISNYQFEFILVNDGSKDNTLQVMEQLYAQRNDVTIVNETRNFGQNAAFTAGLLVCNSDYAIMMDADLQDPVSLLKDICEKFDEGYEVVNPHRASRKTDSWFKRTTAGMFYKFINKLEGKKIVPENVNCFRGLSKRAYQIINNLPEKDRYYVCLVPLVGFKSINVDFKRDKREAGESKYNVKKLFTHAFNIISCSTSSPLYLPIKFGTISSCLFGLLFLIFFIMEICQCCNCFYYPWLFITFITSLVLFAASVIIFFIGILSLYMHNVVINTRNRPATIIDYVKRFDQKDTK